VRKNRIGVAILSSVRGATAGVKYFALRLNSQLGCAATAERNTETSGSVRSITPPSTLALGQGMSFEQPKNRCRSNSDAELSDSACDGYRESAAYLIQQVLHRSANSARSSR
jgi:hypothetical protein